MAAAAAGGRVELVGSVSDDENGDAAVTELGRAGVGHAALLRTPIGARSLEAADVELALSYLSECRVLIVAEPLGEAPLRAAVDGASFHDAHLVVVRQPTDDAAVGLPDTATVLEQPEDDAGAFAGLLGRYAARLEEGVSPADAWREAIAETGWEQAPA